MEADVSERVCRCATLRGPYPTNCGQTGDSELSVSWAFLR
jgi:hypothetical protein